ncbi:MAG: DUF2061 domain-containing protein [Pseudomonadota bacterium]
MKSVPKTANPHDTVFNVNRKRSLAKAVSWRIVGTLDTLLLAFIVLTFLGPLLGMEKTSPSENAQTATYIAITEFLTKLFLYYAHEQIWARVRWAVVLHDGRRRELPRRSGAKTATWRVTASLDTMLLAWIFTGSIATAVSIGTLEVITKLFLYYFHERLWSRVQWGVNTGALPIETTRKS